MRNVKAKSARFIASREGGLSMLPVGKFDAGWRLTQISAEQCTKQAARHDKSVPVVREMESVRSAFLVERKGRLQLANQRGFAVDRTRATRGCRPRFVSIPLMNLAAPLPFARRSAGPHTGHLSRRWTGLVPHPTGPLPETKHECSIPGQTAGELNFAGIPFQLQMSNYESPWMNEELRMYRKTVREFIHAEFLPRQEKWREQHRPDAEAWKQAGQTGLLLPDVPEEYGGGGGTFAHQAVVTEELAQAGVNFGCGRSKYRLALHPSIRERRAKEEVAPGDGAGRTRWSDRDDRAIGGLRLAGHQDDRAPRRRTITYSAVQRHSSRMAGTPAWSALPQRPTPKWPASGAYR